LRTLYLDSDSPGAIQSVIRRESSLFQEDVDRAVRKIFAEVRSLGEAALLEYTRKFDAPDLESLRVTREEIESASVREEVQRAMERAASRIRRFHEEQLRVATAGYDRKGVWSWSFQDETGARIGQRLVPIERVGVYVPGGKASYPSSVWMNCIPALVAGARSLAVCCPPGRDGGLPPAVLVACRLLGIEEVYKLGGAQAIAAMAFGVGMRPVDKIVGPGNAYVNSAKRMVWGLVGLDGWAGPSEACIIADEEAVPAWVAADLLTQLEHSPDTVGYVLCTSETKLKAIQSEVLRQWEEAERREVLETALRDHAAFFLCRDLEEACDLANDIAPEHLSLMVRDVDRWAERIERSGCLYLGDWTPQALGDYLIGPSHTLPTARAARFASPLNVMEFFRFMSVSRLTEDGMEKLADSAAMLALEEGLPAHARGARSRLVKDQ
jgi:histidinol dehydrogenase